ncbi:DUF5678 domain-containing protein [Nostoc sp.]|uniref:DUF5678 domain-containing protein n=1 Tax=Nostoc sp. TaxID=1180 RepID=UPI002FFD0378
MTTNLPLATEIIPMVLQLQPAMSTTGYAYALTNDQFSERDEILKWLNRNRQMLLDLYKNQYIAYNANGIIAHSEKLREVLGLGNAAKQPFLIYLVSRQTASIEILYGVKI